MQRLRFGKISENFPQEIKAQNQSHQAYCESGTIIMNNGLEKRALINIRGLRKNQTIKNYRPNRLNTFRNHDSGSLVSGGGETDFFFGGDFFLMGQTLSGQSSPDFFPEHFLPQDLILAFPALFFFVI